MDEKSEIEKIMKKNFFVAQTGYPPQNGFLDYGPILLKIKQNIVEEWRKVFVDENMYELEASIILSYEVLKSSGHIDKFCDIVFSDGEKILRADHYIEENIGEAVCLPEYMENTYRDIYESIEKKKEGCGTESFSTKKINNILEELGLKVVQKEVSDFTKEDYDIAVCLYNLHSPEGKKLSSAKDFNLIFKLNERQYLRPELAQGQFISFRRLFELNNERLPFASFSIGKSYRNEISARGGMLRTKEFEQAEIEYFSENGDHPRFCEIKSVVVTFLPADSGKTLQMSIGDAQRNGVIKSTAICYYIGCAHRFLCRIGFSEKKIRYRQHRHNEMAHYANDCWDVEIETLSGWVECAGIADRGTYDLLCHSHEINTNVKKTVDPYDHYTIIFDRKYLGKTLRDKSKGLIEKIEKLSQKYIIENKREDNTIEIAYMNSKYRFEFFSRKIDYIYFVPRVIEPSFGISRILYSLVEQSFQKRLDRVILQIKPRLCFLHCVVSYLKYEEGFEKIIENLSREFRDYGIRFRINTRSCTIGRKYSSCDEIGIPYFVTLDSQTLLDGCVTLRDRDTTSQIRIHIKNVLDTLCDLIHEKKTFDELFILYGVRELMEEKKIINKKS